MGTKVAYAGTQKTIDLFIEADGSCPAEEFLNSLSQSDRRKIDVLFERMGQHGRISNTEKFKKLEGSKEVWEFKSFQVRLLCFHAPGKKVVICKGIIKKRDKHAKSDIEFAEACREKFFGEQS